MAYFVSGQAADLIKRRGKQIGASRLYIRRDAHYVQLHFDRYAKLARLRPRSCSSRSGRVISVADTLPYEEFLETRFYEGWARPKAGSIRLKLS
jgi:hypothetical protein